MSERMLVEALIAHHGICTLLELIQQVCDAKAAEYAAYGDIAKAKSFARHSERLSYYRAEG